jgi:hypothetical protein
MNTGLTDSNAKSLQYPVILSNGCLQLGVEAEGIGVSGRNLGTLQQSACPATFHGAADGHRDKPGISVPAGAGTADDNKCRTGGEIVGLGSALPADYLWLTQVCFHRCSAQDQGVNRYRTAGVNVYHIYAIRSLQRELLYQLLSGQEIQT